MQPVHVFLEGDKNPLTTSELAKRTGINRSILTNRARRCERRRLYEGRRCAVFSDKDLRPPISRNILRKKIELSLSQDELEELQDSLKQVDDESTAVRKVKKALKIDDAAKCAIDAWNQSVRQKNG